jgi:hypothetical protein
VNIGGHKVYPCAQTLTGHNVAIAFLTSSGRDALPVEWCAYPALQKPMHFGPLLPPKAPIPLRSSVTILDMWPISPQMIFAARWLQIALRALFCGSV